ncbi:hypothetical protein ACFL1B_06160 [Nanoarchaeota archaeon]
MLLDTDSGLETALRDRLAPGQLYLEDGKPKKLTTEFCSHQSAYDISLSYPTNIMLLTTLAAASKMKGMPTDELIAEAERTGTAKYFDPDESVSSMHTQEIEYKPDARTLDTIAETTLTEFLFMPDAFPNWQLQRESVVNFGGGYKDKEGRVVDKVVHSFYPKGSRDSRTRAIIAEERGLFPQTERAEDITDVFVIDPWDGSKQTYGIMQDESLPGSTLEEKTEAYKETNPEFLVPSIGMAHFTRNPMDEGHVFGSAMVHDIVGERTYLLNHEGIFLVEQVEIQSDEGTDLDFKLEETEIRPFEETDQNTYLAHIGEETYSQNIAALQLPETFQKYQTENTPGPLRPMFLTEHSESVKPRFLVYNGEKMPEWAGAVGWAASSDKFNVYMVSNPEAPSKGGNSMAPSLEESIFRDGHLDLSVLNDNENPAQYRGTFAIVYQEDEELNRHFQELPDATQIKLEAEERPAYRDRDETHSFGMFRPEVWSQTGLPAD